MGDSGSAQLTKLILNNFMVQKKPLARQGKDHVIKRLVRQIRKLREKKPDEETKKTKFNRKAERLVEEIMALKHMAPSEIMKFVILNKKSFSAVIRNPKARIEERALCRLAEHKSLSVAVKEFREQYPRWAEEVPLLIKGLGIRHREKKLKRLKRLGKLDKYLEKEQQSLKLLQELTDVDIDPKIIQGAMNLTKKIEKKPASSRSRKRKREMSVKQEHVGKNKEERETNTVSVKNSKANSLIKIRERQCKKSNNVDDGEIGDSTDDDDGDDDEATDVKRVKRDILAEEPLENDGNSTEEESESEIGEGSVESSDDRSTEPVIHRVGQNLKHKEQPGDNSDSDDGSVGDKESMHSNSDRESDGVTMKVDFVKSNRTLVNKVPSTSGTVKVKQLDLGNISEIIEDDDHAISNSEDEDFFLGKTAKKIKKSKKSTFFLGSGNGNDELDEDGESEDEEEENSDDSGIIDTGKYFRKNMFRNDDSNRGAIRGRGESRERRGNRGRSSDTGRGRASSRGWDRVRGENLGRSTSRSDKDRKKDTGENRGNYSVIERQNDHLGDNEKEVQNDGDRAHKWNTYTENRRGRGRGDRRGGRGMRGGRSPWSERGRRGTFSHSPGSRFQSRGAGIQNGRPHSWERESSNPNLIPLMKKDNSSASPPADVGERIGSMDQESSRGRGRGRPWISNGRRGRGGRRPFMNRDSSNPNMIPLPGKEEAFSSLQKGAASSIGQQENLHPSWQAKLREKQQSVSINEFQGKRMVFNLDD
ncbi:uncharacterized protein DDB_G0283697 [Procambarus clarkii]|uniref:uncharacterized protein DDB_G0283697 n=1 Tax=Procambarus clarkii TaxID=6728 RepID=UPI001E6761AB|nr:uncharacterized protein LOC123770026 [Procambarus clarkii]